MNLENAKEIKNQLDLALGKLASFDECALLDYPDNRNVGDQLIWLGNIFYLSDALKVKVKYASTIANFSDSEMQKCINSDAPILLHGGGNLGDLWQRHQIFRENIISKYQDTAIIILPQTIYYSEAENLAKTAKIFNYHPNLTIFVRDEYSYKIAIDNFYNCKIVKSPDTAFQLVDILKPKPDKSNTILYHARQDIEKNVLSTPMELDLPNLVVQDWFSFRKEVIIHDSLSYKYSDTSEFLPWEDRWKIIKSIAYKSRQEGLTTMQIWLSRLLWQYCHKESFKFQQHYQPYMHRRSWGFLQSGIQQFKQHRLVITTRLHGHILCVILGIPHVFLANSYYKNEAFYQTWTYQIPFCKFVKNTAEIESAVQELLELYPK
jgi:pyruvyl transferase EpsO